MSSSSTRHHHHHGDTKNQKALRRILAFFLFLTVSLLSLTVCVRLSFVSKGAIVNTLTSDTYVQGVYKSVSDYAHDLCDECSVPYESVDSAVTYNTVYKIQKAYFNGILSASEEFTDTTYQDYIKDVGENVKASTLSLIKTNSITVDGNVNEKVTQFSENIENYLKDVTELSFTNYINTIVSVGGIASIIAMAALLLVAVVFALLIISIGKKPYRAIRDMAYSFYAAALLNIILTLGVQAVKHFKTLVLYPLYLSDAIMEYVLGCQISVALSSVVLFLIGIALTTAVWCIKRNESI